MTDDFVIRNVNLKTLTRIQLSMLLLQRANDASLEGIQGRTDEGVEKASSRGRQAGQAWDGQRRCKRRRVCRLEHVLVLLLVAGVHVCIRGVRSDHRDLSAPSRSKMCLMKNGVAWRSPGCDSVPLTHVAMPEANRCSCPPPLWPPLDHFLDPSYVVLLESMLQAHDGSWNVNLVRDRTLLTRRWMSSMACPSALWLAIQA